MFADLFDFTSEKDFNEALLFYFVYFVIGYYYMVGLGLSLNGTKSSDASVFLFHLVPSIFCASLCMLSMYKKRLNDVESFFSSRICISSTVSKCCFCAIFRNGVRFVYRNVPGNSFDGKE